MGKDKDFSVFIKSGHVMYSISCVVYFRLKAFGNKRENKTHREIGHSTVFNHISLLMADLSVKYCFNSWHHQLSFAV